MHLKFNEYLTYKEEKERRGGKERMLRTSRMRYQIFTVGRKGRKERNSSWEERERRREPTRNSWSLQICPKVREIPACLKRGKREKKKKEDREKGKGARRHERASPPGLHHFPSNKGKGEERRTRTRNPSSNQRHIHLPKRKKKKGRKRKKGKGERKQVKRREKIPHDSLWMGGREKERPPQALKKIFIGFVRNKDRKRRKGSKEDKQSKNEDMVCDQREGGGKKKETTRAHRFL